MGKLQFNLVRIQGGRAIGTLQTADGMIEVRVQFQQSGNLDDRQQHDEVMEKIRSLAIALQTAAEDRD